MVDDPCGVPANSQTTALVAGADLVIDGTNATAAQKADPGNYSGHDFFDTIGAALDPEQEYGSLADLSTSSSLTLELKGVHLPDVGADVADSRYVVAEFVAISGATTAISYEIL